MSLKNKRILITAGPTWTAIDPVRVISNVATGVNGQLLAQALARRKAKVTLLLGPGQAFELDKRIDLIRFNFFGELEELLRNLLSERSYDHIIHSAAVSDYRPDRVFKKKVDSNKPLTIRLVPQKKLISMIRRLAPGSFLVGFKFVPETPVASVMRAAIMLVKKYGLDAVVANTTRKGLYQAAILDACGRETGVLHGKKKLVEELVKTLGGNA